ncbi:Hypothetical predicted protein [Mytilus galloprovincialis]|uniref:DZIP3-like HEPN domain-containing protein n=2 Tax=Mytilus galloprovincialis TaxID=29158 RepID=A0A8B6EUI6_MYTGA|nr:Hypothetical predicted protein [Mytilus galloprovincialis]
MREELFSERQKVQDLSRKCREADADKERMKNSVSEKTEVQDLTRKSAEANDDKERISRSLHTERQKVQDLMRKIAEAGDDKGPTTVTSADLDLTLIVCLLRNIPPLVTEPSTGFDNLPPPHDKSDGANIARLKYYKNFLVSHSKDGTLPNADFVRIWSELEQAITGLDNSLATAASLKDAKTKMLDNLMVQLLSTQMQLVRKVSNFEEELKHISSHIDKDVQDKKQLKQITETLDERMKVKEDSFEMEYKECKENVDRLSERLNTSEVQLYDRVERIEKYLEEIQKLQQSLDLQFTRIKTIAIESKKEKEDFVKDVQSLCSLIQVDITKHEERIAALENSSGTLQEIQRDVDSLKRKLDTLKEEIKKQVEDHIPPHIQAHHEQEIGEWEQDQTTFLETRATRHILESLPSHNCIVVTGSSGCDVGDYSEIEKIFKLQQDVAGKNDETVLKVSSPKLLLSCRLHIYKEAQFQRISLFTKKECNLLSPELCLLEAERIHMLHKYLPDDIIDNIKQVTENVDYFPLLCKLSKDKTSEEVKKLFTVPLISIKQNINNIIHENKEQFCVLVLCIIFNEGFDTDWLKLGSVSERKNMELDKLEYIVKEFDIDLSKQKHRNSLKACFSTLNGTYLKLRGTEYRMIHDKIYKMAAVICGQHLTECFIKYAPAIFIRDNFIFESVTDVHENDNLIVLKDEEEDYFERLLCDLTRHAIISTFNNYQLIHKTFRDKLISFLKRRNDANTVLTKLDTEGCKTIEYGDQEYPYDTHYYTTPLIESSKRACKGGYKDTVELLLQNNADVNQCNEGGISPLYEACAAGHKDTVQLLLQNNANVNQCECVVRSPLRAACRGGYKDTVELLLQNNADVNQCKMDVISPLFVACLGGHKDTVEMLLHNNADVNQCDFFGDSPLIVACAGGHKETVEMLLQNNADVNQCEGIVRFPLFAACTGGHRDTVELLLQNNADVNQCGKYGTPPLYMACEGGHKDTAELLLQNNADVNQCNKVGISPLYKACAGGHKDTVELLLQRNANVNQCAINGESPLYVASEVGYRDTVKLLLQNNANVSKCNEDGQSPLFVACKGGFKDTVELLLQRKADVSQCNTKGDSPLHAVCSLDSNFHPYFNIYFMTQFSKRIIETVKPLLAWKADVTLRNKNGQTPLDIARASHYCEELINLLEETIQLKESQLK